MKWLWANFFFLFTTISFSQTTFNIPSENLTIHGTTFGAGEPILIINGGPGMNSEGFTSLAKELGKTNLAILYDQRGTGQSFITDINAETMTMDLMVEDIETIREYFGFKDWIVLGHSFGGMLASYYVKKNPERITGLILSGSGGFDLSITGNLNLQSRLTQKERDSLSFWNEKISQGDNSYQTLYNRGKYLAPAYVYDKKHVPVIAKRLTHGNMTINSLIWQNIRSINFDCSEAFKTFKKPVLIIQGQQDVMGDAIAKESHRLLANSKLIFVDKCVHYGWLEQPAEYFDAIDLFLENL